ncbi:response regulator transcription factor [uncultured Ruminococcus sp.]|uniref:response regulator transcription factor n=1 Tax=uncultured Ruminococcus sp. TaxID=165186 RepID=UPI00262CE32E|nr:response regulator transcription factor [uncultured Ruminococcus sp.]
MVDILLIEDNSELSGLLCEFLRNEKYIVSVADSGEKALSLYEKYGARLVLLDINLPGIDGFEVCERIRKQDNVPIIVLTARSDRDDKLNGLLLGADDYIEKPYDIDILIAKIKGIFSRRLAIDFLTDGDISLNLALRTATLGGQPLQLTSKEFDLLELFISSKGQTLTKEYIFNRIWGSDSDSELQTLTVHIKWLREKVERDPKNPEKILTVWGKGYRWGG